MARRENNGEVLDDVIKSFTSEVRSVQDVFGLLKPDSPERPRYLKTLDACSIAAERQNDARPLELCDLGGYFGVIAAAVETLGFNVHVVDSYGTLLAGGEHIDLERWWGHREISVYDVDLQAGDLRLPFDDDSFDVVTILAVLEHFPHSPRLVLEEAHRILRPSGMLIVDGPNAGAFGARVGFLMHGEGLWAPISDLYFSEVPFQGHSRCYSRGEMVSVLEWARFEPSEIALFDLPETSEARSWLHRVLYGVVYRFVLRRIPTLRNCLWIAARPV